jgi:AraC-like DNA-binding protein
MLFDENQICNFTQNSFRHICTVSPEAKSMFFYILEIGRIKSNDAYRFENENLNSFLLAIVLEGKASLTYKGHNFHLNEGTCFFIDCLEPHIYQSDASCDVMFIHFSGVSASEYYKLFDSTYVNVVRPADLTPFKETMTKIADINIRSIPYTELITSKLITDLLTMLITFKNADYDENSKVSVCMTRIKQYIDEHFADEIYLEVLAEKFGISKFNITREFKKIFGINISKYILSKRLSYSKHLLRFSDKSIEEISAMCGFYDTSYFNKQFKASEDITPLKYRKSWTAR